MHKIIYVKQIRNVKQKKENPSTKMYKTNGRISAPKDRLPHHELSGCEIVNPTPEMNRM